MLPKIIKLPVNKHSSGNLISLSSLNEIPFTIERFYTIYLTNSNEPRGFHAHKNLKQAIFCINGSVDIYLDDGFTKSTITLDDPTKCLLIEKPIWREMLNFTENCILNVLCDQPYNSNDYIRNYDNFLKLIKNEK